MLDYFIKQKLYACGYIVIMGLFCHAIAIPEVIKSFLALPSFFFLPWLFGDALIYVKRFLRRTQFPHSTSQWYFLISWLFGVFSLCILATLLQLLRMAFMIKNLHVIVIVFIILTIIHKSFLQKHQDGYKSNWKVSIISNKDLLLCIMIGLVPAIIARAYVPFSYYGFGWMLPTLINQPALRIIEYGYVDLSLTRWPDYVLIALMSMIFNTEPMSLIWSLPFLLAPLYSIGLYYLSIRIFKNKVTSILASLVGLFININSPGFFDQFIENPRNNTFLYAIFPLTLVYIDEKIDKSYKIKDVFLSMLKLITLFTLSYIFLESGWYKAKALNLPVGFRAFYLRPLGILATIILGYLITILSKNNFSRENFTYILLIALTFEIFHESECWLFFSVILAYILFCQILKKRGKKNISFTVFCNRTLQMNIYYFSLYLLISLISLYILLQRIGFLKIYTYNWLSSIIEPTLKASEPVNVFPEKWRWFESANSPIIIAILLIGILFMIFPKKLNDLLVVSMFCFTLFIYFFPDYWTYRAYKEFSPFMALIIANSLYSIGKLLTRACNQFYQKNINRYLVYLYFVLILAIMIPNLILPVYARFSFTPFGQQFHTNIANYEYETALWLRENTTKNSIIISDYRTMILLTPLANKIWLTERKMNALSLSVGDQELVSYIKNEIFLAPNSKHAYEAIWNLSNQIPWMEQLFLKFTGLSQTNLTFVVIISTRTAKWIEQEGIGDIPLPQYGGVNPKYLKNFNDTNYFTQLFNIDNEIYVFDVKIKN